jgi:hypothetical protein
MCRAERKAYRNTKNSPSMLTYLQMDISFDLWKEILNVGGLVAVLLAFAVFVLWKKLSEKEAALATLNAQIKEDAKESMQIVTSVEGLLDRMLTAQADGEKRIIASVAREAGHIKELIHAYKQEHNNQKGENG